MRAASPKLQQKETKLNTITNDLQRYQQEVSTQRTTKEELDSNVTDLNMDVERHRRTIAEHKILMVENHRALNDVVREHQQEKSNLVRLKSRTSVRIKLI